MANHSRDKLSFIGKAFMGLISLGFTAIINNICKRAEKKRKKDELKKQIDNLRDDLHGFGGVWNHSEIEKKKREMEELDNPNLQKQSEVVDEAVEFETFVD